MVTTEQQAHVLLTPATCPCDKTADYPSCNVCDGGLAICSVCGKAECDLDEPCTPRSPTTEQVARDIVVTALNYHPDIPLTPKYQGLVAAIASALTTQRNQVLEEVACLVDNKATEYERLGDYGINQDYVRKVEAANELAASIRARLVVG